MQRLAALTALLVGSIFASGCTTAIVLMHVHDKLTENDPLPCISLNSVERALSERCGEFEPRSLRTRDIASSGLPECPLSLAARDPQFWPVLTELLSRGAQPERCRVPPLVALAQAQPCPDFAAASQPALQSLNWLAQADARSIHHDVVRMLSCPSARAVRLDGVLDGWLAQGLMPAGGLSFSPIGALHPSHLRSSLGRALQAEGHTARAAFGGYEGRLMPGFEQALRDSEWQALDWWFTQMPELANRVPPAGGNQLPWVPLAQVLTPSFMPDGNERREMVGYLLARGADPWRRLPHDRGQSVVALARQLKSPLLPLLDPPPAPALSEAATMTAARVLPAR